MRVYLAHGKESSPWSAKMIALADIAKAKGFWVDIPDYSDLSDPDERVERLVEMCGESNITTVLVGSSMGGYVSTVASSAIKPNGLFLIAPAFYLPEYQVQEPVPCSKKTVVIHGWNDEVVPVDNSILFARNFRSDLHLVDGSHRLESQLPLIEKLFALFLDGIIEQSLTVNGLTIIRIGWGDVAEAVSAVLDTAHYDKDQCLDWIRRVWIRVATQGDADYASENERLQVIIRLTSLVDFFQEFLKNVACDSDIESDCDGPCEGHENKGGCDTALKCLVSRVYCLSSLVPNYGDETDDSDEASVDDPTPVELRQSYEQATHEVIYPAILKEYISPSRLANALYRVVCPLWWETDSSEFLNDPDEPDHELGELEDLKGYQFVLSLVESKLSTSSSGND